ncbi:MAG: sodium transporter [SAR86 cluster bacterium]|uniref:Sodium transporter n=1 Tax=SAR86 cluster bacterium TaxID=2030880 RepID=A0A520M9G4_9GAMM|nr:MAG: sodium transporter [SAR86 cluster bacterium]|tara:strand:+ start:5666 stop:7228 length:1563 start_codon:yes stop_codon:yes gene_type:complete
MLFNSLDLAILAIYCIGIISLATYVSRQSSGQERSAEDYFLAGRSLPWWAIGASLIAANISAEQIIGMSGQGFVVGMAIATYELTAAIALIVMAKFFLPLFLEKQIYTMPQFLEQRFDNRVSLVLSFFWLAVYIFINLTSVLWLGSLAINALTGIDLFYGLILLAGLSLAYSLWGGLKAVALTDIIQVVLLIFGGLSVSYIALTTIGDGQLLKGLVTVYNEVPEKFDMILSPDNPAYNNLPGVWVLIGGLWIAHFAYWGFNQYITQRALGAKSLPEAQKGVMFAAYLKILMPLVIVLPGICAAVLYPTLEKSDQAYPTMMALLPHGLLGLTFAALVAAIVSSLASMTNSVSTIFTMDIYRSFAKTEPSQGKLITIGRNIAWIALVIAVICAKPLLGSLESAFQYIQEFTGFFTPGILVIFLVALFWKKATTLSVLIAAGTSLTLSVFIWYFFPDYPFIHRMGVVFLVSGFTCYMTTLIQGYSDQEKAIDLKGINFSTSKGFNYSTVVILAVLTVIYGLLW